MFQPDLLKDKVVVITGGGTGLGRSMGERFLQLGAKLAITSRRDEVLRQAAAEMTAAHGGEVFAVTCDVRDPEAVDHMIAAVWEHYDGIDVLVNNAAGNFASPTERLSHRAVDSVLGIVLHGTVLLHAGAGQTLDRGGTRRPRAQHRHHLRRDRLGLRRAIGRGQGGRAGDDAFAGRRVGEVRHHAERHRARPLPHAGRMGAADAEPRAGQIALNRIPLKRVGRHEELANLAAYLIADGSAYINGECVVIDGGEWLKGAGQFTWLEALSDTEWDAFAARARGAR